MSPDITLPAYHGFPPFSCCAIVFGRPAAVLNKNV
ncbi:MAG: hypothetical protein ACI9MU_001779 [Alphaproteobacteria bacterium]